MPHSGHAPAPFGGGCAQQAARREATPEHRDDGRAGVLARNQRYRGQESIVWLDIVRSTEDRQECLDEVRDTGDRPEVSG